jgi:membrane protein DedA with SNARE-associated domain
VNELLGWILNAVRDVDPVLRILLAGTAIFCETSILIGLVVPGDTVVIVASTGITNWLEFGALLVATVVGALGGESVGFALGHYFGPKIRRSRLGRRIGEGHWTRAENYLDRRGGIAIFISRFLPVLHSLIPLTVGMSAMRYRKFIAWTAPACILWAVAYVSVGWAAADSYRHLSDRLHFAGYVFVGIIVVFFILVLLIKKLIERREARHMEHPGDGDPNTRDDA